MVPRIFAGFLIMAHCHAAFGLADKGLVFKDVASLHGRSGLADSQVPSTTFVQPFRTATGHLPRDAFELGEIVDSTLFCEARAWTACDRKTFLSINRR